MGGHLLSLAPFSHALPLFAFVGPWAERPTGYTRTYRVIRHIHVCVRVCVAQVVGERASAGGHQQLFSRVGHNLSEAAAAQVAAHSAPALKEPVRAPLLPIRWGGGVAFSVRLAVFRRPWWLAVGMFGPVCATVES